MSLRYADPETSGSGTGVHSRWPIPSPDQLAGMALLAVLAMPVVLPSLLLVPDADWQVDLEVYRTAAETVVSGGDLYAMRTPPPQLLPFTYPPFAALVALPLWLGSFAAMGWIWSAVQVFLLWVCVGVAFRRVLDRFGERRGLARGALAGVCTWFLPVTEGLYFGQVNSVIVTLCLLDVATARRERLPKGVLVGLATAVKLTPAVFWVHWAVTRQWRALLVSVGTAAGATAVTAVVLPRASFVFWTRAVFDSERLGANSGTSNQSIRGVLLRLGPDNPVVVTLLWLGLAGLVCLVGFALAARFERAGEPVAIVAAVGMVAVLVSPVSWVHHMHWAVVAVAALLGDGRRLDRILLSLALSISMVIELPWIGHRWLFGAADYGVPRWVARIFQNCYVGIAPLVLLGLWYSFRRSVSSRGGDRH
jgi:alpha-1,2-mannosyltransferase